MSAQKSADLLRQLGGQRAMRAEAHGKLFARTAVQESAYGQRIEQVVALRGERADHTGKHITAAALGQCRAARDGDAHAPVRRGR